MSHNLFNTRSKSENFARRVWWSTRDRNSADSVVAIELHMVPLNSAVYFSNIKTLFDENGKIKEDSYGGRLKKLFDELVWYADALKMARGK